MDEFARRFWDQSSTYGVQPALTDDALADCEALLGVTLPVEYVALLRVRSGGAVAPRYSAFPTRDLFASAVMNHERFEFCSGIGPASPSITESPYLNREWGQPDELVLLHGEGHWWIALDYRSGRTAEPSVAWYDNESGEDVTLADTFVSFLDMLKDPPPIEAYLL